MSDRFKFRHVNEITGTFVLIVVAVLIAVVVWTGHSQRWFKSRVLLRISLPEAGAAGIRQGSEVYFLGTLVGSVSDVIVDEEAGMEAQASIRRDFFRFVRVDSSAVVRKKFGVAGDSFFEISRGEGQPLREKHARIICNEEAQSALERAVKEVRDEALLVLKKAGTGLETWTRLGADLGETRQRLDQLALRLDNLVAGIEAGQGSVGMWITDTALADAAQQLLAEANESMGELRAMVTNLNVVVRNVQDGTARLPDITAAIADEAKDLPGTVQQAQVSMRELERLIEAMQRHWLLRKYVNQTHPPPLRPRPEPAAPVRTPVKVLRSPKDSEQ